MKQRRGAVLFVVGLLVAGAGIAGVATRSPAGEDALDVVPAPARPTVSESSVGPEQPVSVVPATPDLAPCAPGGLQIDVVPTKATFVAGDTVGGMFFVQTAGSRDCAVAMPASFRIEDVATGTVVGNVPATSEYPSAIKADGKMYTSTFAWDRQDCSGPSCIPVPPALYQAVAEWTPESRYRGWGEFRIAG